MTPVESQTQEALRRAASILKGTPANSFPQITESAKNYLFDYPTLNKWGIDWKELPQNSIFLNMPFVVRYQTYIILCGILLTLFILWTLFYQRVQYRREASHKKQAQESLRKEKEFLSLALESGDIFAFRYSNGVFEFDHDFYKSLDMPINRSPPRNSKSLSTLKTGKISSNISTCLIQDSLPVRSPAADIISTAKGIYGGNSDMRKRRMDKTLPAIMSE